MFTWKTAIKTEMMLVLFSCCKLSQLVKFTCWLLKAGSLTAGVKSVVAVIVRLIGPVIRIIVRVIKAIRKIRPNGSVGAVGVVVDVIVSVRPAGPARCAGVAR